MDQVLSNGSADRRLGKATVRLICAGDNVVDVYPDLGVLYPGGNAVNVAVHARRVGADAAYIGVIGSDSSAVALHAALSHEGVDLAGMRVVDGPNARAVVRLLGGDRYFESGHVGVSAFDLTAQDIARMSQADAVHTGECSRLEAWLPRMSTAAKMLSFDFSERPWDYVRAHVSNVDVAVISRPGSSDRDAVALVRGLQALGPSLVAVTRGSAGAVVGREGDIAVAPAGEVEPVDTIGAGDAFIARLLFGAVVSEPVDLLARESTRYASSTCREHGAFGYETPLPADLPLDKHVSAAPLSLEEHR